MTKEFNTKERNPVAAFRNIASLYTVLQNRRHHLRIRRASLNLRGEVRAEALDFICDVELKARRILNTKEFEMFRRCVSQGEPELVPREMQRNLGQIWNDYDLNYDGPYGRLYFMVKNEQKIRETTEVENATDN